MVKVQTLYSRCRCLEGAKFKPKSLCSLHLQWICYCQNTADLLRCKVQSLVLERAGILKTHMRCSEGWSSAASKRSIPTRRQTIRYSAEVFLFCFFICLVEHGSLHFWVAEKDVEGVVKSQKNLNMLLHTRARACLCVGGEGVPCGTTSLRVYLVCKAFIRIERNNPNISWPWKLCKQQLCAATAYAFRLRVYIDGTGFITKSCTREQGALGLWCDGTTYRRELLTVAVFALSWTWLEFRQFLVARALM